MKSHIALLITFFLLASLIAQAEGWEDYQFGRFAEVIASSNASVKKVNNYFTPGMPYKIRVTYGAKMRNITPSRKAYLEKWLKTNGLNPELINTFTKEVLVKEDAVDYWVLVQHVLIA